MQNSKLADLLRSFNPYERRAFRELVASPYFNRNPDVSRLFSWLDDKAPDFSSASRAAAHAHLFPENPQPDEARLNHAMSFLLKLAEDFVGLEFYWKQPFAHPNNVLRSLEARGLEKHYQFNLEKTRRVFGRETRPGGSFFYSQYLTEISEAERFVRHAPRQFNESVQKATDSLDAFYLLEKLRRTCYMYTSQAILATPYNLQLVDEICRFVGANLDAMPSPAIEGYYRIFQLLSRDDPDEDFQALKSLLAEHSPEFAEEDLRDVYQYAINFCNIQIMKGREQYVSEVFDLYGAGVESGILLEKGKLSPWHFKNIVNLALRLRHYAWTEKFIERNTGLLPDEFQADALHYNFALLFYRTKRFDEALQHLHKVEFTDIHYSLGAKVMLSQIYYENGDFDALESLLHAFNAYLRRNKLISESVRQAYANFVHLLKKIARALPEQFPKLQLELEGQRVFASKEWLLEILQR